MEGAKYGAKLKENLLDEAKGLGLSLTFEQINLKHNIYAIPLDVTIWLRLRAMIMFEWLKSPDLNVTDNV